METLHTNPPKSSLHESAGARTAARFAVADRELRPAMGATATDEAFIELLHFYRCRGGMAREIEVLSHLKCRAFQAGQPASRPSEFDRAVRFSWGGWTWLPLFQFNREDLSLRAQPLRVVDELMPVFDGWEVTRWFAARNTWLRDQLPIDVMDENLSLVIEAARVDRFIAAG